MSITSFSFLAFCCVAVLTYYIMPLKRRWYVLLAFSLAYYLLSATPTTILYLLISVLSVYAASRYFEAIRRRGENIRGQMPGKAKLVLILALLLNIGLLVALKYINFIIFNINQVTAFFGSTTRIYNVDWIASLGISYYTLQMVAYLCDSYWGRKFAIQRNPLKLLLFGCYFPQILSGPISRYEQISEQLYSGQKFDYERAVFGIQRILWGLFKKLVVAERLGLFVDVVYESPHGYSAFYIWIATFAFAIQLYTDFSGAMDIVFGISECFGIYLPENFDSPFLAKNIQEFWQRWHITLGTWLRDYIMYPVQKSQFMISLGDWLKKVLGKKRGKRCGAYLAMLCVWLGMGLWHGSGWKYIVGEGVWFWLVIVLGRECEPLFQKIVEKCGIKTDCFSWRVFQSLRTFWVFSVGMLFFRAVTLREALRLISLSITMDKITAMRSIVGIGLDGRQWFICLMGMIAVLTVDVLHQKSSVRKMIAGQNLVFRWFVYLVLIFAVLLLGKYGPGYNAADFIYQLF